jgi:hypothetical protein
MSQYLIDQIRAIPIIRVELNSEVVAVSGDEHLASFRCKTRRSTRFLGRRARDIQAVVC